MKDENNIEDISDFELKKLLNDQKRHSELMAAISKLLEPKQTSSVDIRPYLEKNNSIISSFIEKVGNIKFEQKEHQAPQVNVTTDNKDVIEEIKTLNQTAQLLVENQKKIMELLSMKPTKLELVRNSTLNTLSHVDIKYKNV